MKKRLFSLARKESLHIIRDARSLYLAIGLPVVLVILFGFAVTLDVRNIRMGIIDMDGSALSRDLAARIAASPYFQVRFRSRVYANFERRLMAGDIQILLVIPQNLARGMARGHDMPLQILVDGSDNKTAMISLGYLSGILQKFSLDAVSAMIRKEGFALPIAIPPIQSRTRIWFNPELSSANFIIPGLIAVIMMILASMLTSLTIAKEWENGTMEQLIASPARPFEIIVGKLIPYFGLGLVQTALIVLPGVLIFNVPLKGNLPLLFLVTGIFLICGLGTGLFISTVTRSQQLAFMLSIIFTMLPAFLLSGFIFPISSMPKLIRMITGAVPAKYFLTMIRGIFLKGNSLNVLWPDLIPLTGFAVVIILGCIKRMRLSLE